MQKNSQDSPISSRLRRRRRGQKQRGNEENKDPNHVDCCPRNPLTMVTDIGTFDDKENRELSETTTNVEMWRAISEVMNYDIILLPLLGRDEGGRHLKGQEEIKKLCQKFCDVFQSKNKRHNGGLIVLTGQGWHGQFVTSNGEYVYISRMQDYVRTRLFARKREFVPIFWIEDMCDGNYTIKNGALPPTIRNKKASGKRKFRIAAEFLETDSDTAQARWFAIQRSHPIVPLDQCTLDVNDPRKQTGSTFL